MAWIMWLAVSEPQAKTCHPTATEHFLGAAKAAQSTLNVSISGALGTIFACLLPVLSTAILYFLGSKMKRLGAIVAFTALFSLSMVVLTAARPGEIFAATNA